MKTALIILDGFGEAQKSNGNAISQAKTPNLDNLMSTYATTTLCASGLAVGLPEGQMGNSEVGHLNIGAGRIVYQDITAIDKLIRDEDFYMNEAMLNAILNVKQNGSTLHIMGLLGDGGIHSHINHLKAIIELCKRNNLANYVIHVITDGRDTDPKSAIEFIKDIPNIATVTGRYYAMDRDNNMDRVQIAFDCIFNGQGEIANTASDAILNSYANGKTDEFILPTVIGDYNGAYDDDSIIFFNYRSDRARQITKKITEERGIHFVCMTQYDANIEGVSIAFPPRSMSNTLGEVFAKNNLTQIRAAETEKYAHVTFFFNGGIEEPYEGEERILVASPKVATYDLKPEMSAIELTDAVIDSLDTADVLIMNYANPDMVGHTGNIPATIKAIECVDTQLGRIINELNKLGCITIITADHGNAEQMLSDKGTPFTAHTSNDVPLVIVGKDFPAIRKLKNGALCDVAPTMLKLLGIKQPAEMDGESLF